MDTVISLLVLSTLPQLVVPVVPSATFSAVVEIVSGDSRIFSGESVRLKCTVPDIKSTWNHLWFRGSEQLPQTGESLTLWRASVKDSGKYYCQGVRNTVVGKIHTLQSLPLEINVDGGWAILQVPRHPGLVGNTLKLTCRVRLEPPLHEVILYKNGIEVMRQRGLNPHINLTNLTPEDTGMYSCRASWDVERRTRSVISADVPVQVLEVLSQPVLEIVTDNNLFPANKMKLICHHQYNAPAPAPSVNYYFFKNGRKLGPSTSENHDLVTRTPGLYSCKARVPELNLSMLSEPKGFGQVAGPRTVTPPIPHRRVPRPLAPPASPPPFSLPPTAKPTAPQPSLLTSTAPEVKTQSSAPPLKPTQPAPSTLLSTVKPLNQTLTPEPKTANASGESGDLSGESGDLSGESGDMPEESGDISQDFTESVIIYQTLQTTAETNHR